VKNSGWFCRRHRQPRNKLTQTRRPQPKSRDSPEKKAFRQVLYRFSNCDSTPGRSHRRQFDRTDGFRLRRPRAGRRPCLYRQGGILPGANIAPTAQIDAAAHAGPGSVIGAQASEVNRMNGNIWIKIFMRCAIIQEDNLFSLIFTITVEACIQPNPAPLALDNPQAAPA
jgi:hypothetical protein